jgi:hypothetical protein
LIRRGLATGLAVTAFGGGALLATPVTLALYEHFFELPQYLGAVSDVQMITKEGTFSLFPLSYTYFNTPTSFSFYSFH